MFLLVGQAIGAALLFGSPTSRLWGRRWLVVLLGAYLFLSMPLASDGLVTWLDGGYPRVRLTNDAPGVEAIVVLGNGVQVRRAAGRRLDTLNLPSAFSALEVARLYSLLGYPQVLASGGVFSQFAKTTESEVMQNALIELGVPQERIQLESQSRTTREQVLNTGAWLRSRGIERFVLVTSPDHMRRAAGTFKKAGFSPIPSISQLRYGGTSPLIWPTRYALQGSEAAIYEYMALIYYWLRGWL